MVPRSAILAAASSLAVAACGDGAQPEVVCPPPASKPVRSSQCGPTLELTPINDYHGDIAAVQDREDAVVLVNGCTGTLIAAQAGPVILTAGHCVGRGDRVLMAFNYEVEPDGDPLVTEGTVFEQSLEPEYALIRPDALPAVAPTPLMAGATDRLVIIQHPRGGLKAVAEGRFAGACGGIISYTDLDTLVGSSGAGVLDRDGHLIGIHTDGDCALDGSGSNYGWSAESIVEASPYLQDTDIADRPFAPPAR
jgi:hypothetical protein